MAKINFPNKLCIIAFLGLVSFMPISNAFADSRGGHEYRGGHDYRPRHEAVVVRGSRYNYHDGRWYRPSWFGLNFSFVFPPTGATVTYIPDRCRTIVVGGISYYEYDNVYYRRSPSGYVVVSRPVVNPDVVYVPSITPPQTQERETVTINVPDSRGNTIAITLVRYPNGFVGPQGEFYPDLPTAEQLRARYGR